MSQVLWGELIVKIKKQGVQRCQSVFTAPTMKPVQRDVAILIKKRVSQHYCLLRTADPALRSSIDLLHQQAWPLDRAGWMERADIFSRCNTSGDRVSVAECALIEVFHRVELVPNSRRSKCCRTETIWEERKHLVCLSDTAALGRSRKARLL